MNLPNLLSLLRILLIPLFVLLFYMPMQWTNWLCAAVFGLAGVTDWLDGYLARKWNQTTPFGAFIDPVADKLMVVVALGEPGVPVTCWADALTGQAETMAMTARARKRGFMPTSQYCNSASD